jgi:hypothetical protein
MKNPRTLVFLLVAAGFIAFLIYGTIKPQRVECEVCVAFNGGDRCAKASGPDRKAASETAQTAACGPLASGMDQTIACGRVEPRAVTCSGS